MASLYDWSSTAASNSNADADINWAEGQTPGSVNDSARTVMKRVRDFVTDMAASNTAGGSADALTLTSSAEFGTLGNGRVVSFKAASDNTGAATINVNLLGAKSIIKQTSSGETALSAGDIQADGLYLIMYSTAFNSGSGGWQLLNPSTLNGSLTSLSISSTSAGTLATLTSTEAGATSGPDIELYRDSASPAASDVMGSVLFYGEDSAGNKELYGSIRANIIDPTSTSEDGEIVIRTDGAGTVADRLHVRLGAYMDGATGGDQGAGTINATAVYDDGVKLGITADTAQATTSGTSKDFTGIPAGVKRVTVIVSDVSQNGTGVPMIQLGDSGGVEATGYSGSMSGVTDGFTATTNHNTGFLLSNSTGATDKLFGVAEIVLLNTAGTTWVFSWTGALSNQDYTFHGAGAKTLSGTLDRIRFTTDTGTTFDDGAVNIHYQ